MRVMLQAFIGIAPKAEQEHCTVGPMNAIHRTLVPRSWLFTSTSFLGGRGAFQAPFSVFGTFPTAFGTKFIRQIEEE